jgi:formate dehydrogenase
VGAREEWQIFVDLALAMKRPLFGYRGVNGFVRATRTLSKLTRRPALEFTPHWIDRLLVATGRRIKWRDIMAHPHGWVFGPREFGHFKDALKTDDKMIHAAPSEFVERAHELLAGPQPEAPQGYPFQLASRRNRHSMNSWLNELPGLHPSGKRSEVVIHPDDAAPLGISDGDQVRVFSPVGEIKLTAAVSDQPRPGVVIVDHGWGSRIFDPRTGNAPESYGVNRNLLIDGSPVDPLSQQPAMSSSYVGIARLG